MRKWAKHAQHQNLGLWFNEEDFIEPRSIAALSFIALETWTPPARSKLRLRIDRKDTLVHTFRSKQIQDNTKAEGFECGVFGARPEGRSHRPRPDRTDPAPD